MSAAPSPRGGRQLPAAASPSASRRSNAAFGASCPPPRQARAEPSVRWSPPRTSAPVSWRGPADRWSRAGPALGRLAPGGQRLATWARAGHDAVDPADQLADDVVSVGLVQDLVTGTGIVRTVTSVRPAAAYRSVS